MITLHHLENSASIRILWLLEEVGLPFELVMYDRDPKTMLAPDRYKALSPLGTAPVITDGSVAISESAAIIDYVVDQLDDPALAQSLRPEPGDPLRADYLFWFHAAGASVQPMLTMRFVHGIAGERAPRLVRGLARRVLGAVDDAFTTPRLRAALGALDKQLTRHPYIAGDRFTAADIAFGYTLLMAGLRGGTLDAFPEIRAYVARMCDRPAWQRALARDGKFAGLPS